MHKSAGLMATEEATKEALAELSKKSLESKIELNYGTINAILCLGLYQERMLRYLQKKEGGYDLAVENLYEGYQRLKPMLKSVLSVDVNKEMQFIEKIYLKFKQNPNFGFDDNWITNNLVY